jgi:hypothetical protein
MKKHLPIAILVVGFSFALASSAFAYDRTEAENCAGCHFNPNMAEVVATWEESAHASTFHGFNGNTYCSGCHSPLEADAAATSSSNAPVPLETWQSVTCASCHPPHDLRVEWETPLGLYDIAANADPNNYPDMGYVPLYRDESNLLCESCHTGLRHTRDFQGFGRSMFEKKAVMCIDCHMAVVPNPVQGEPPFATHTFDVAANLPWSCGTVPDGCHSNKTEAWAAKQIAKEKLHGKLKSH